jgi:hypothetical protein
MIGDSRPISLQVLVNGGTAVSAKAVSLDLIVTELVINALKHAFPKDRPDGQVVVSYQIDGSDWKLVVSDNGIGKSDVVATLAKGGLGTTLVKALALYLPTDSAALSIHAPMFLWPTLATKSYSNVPVESGWTKPTFGSVRYRGSGTASV